MLIVKTSLVPQQFFCFGWRLEWYRFIQTWSDVRNRTSGIQFEGCSINTRPVYSLRLRDYIYKIIRQRANHIWWRSYFYFDIFNGIRAVFLN